MPESNRSWIIRGIVLVGLLGMTVGDALRAGNAPPRLSCSELCLTLLIVLRANRTIRHLPGLEPVIYTLQIMCHKWASGRVSITVGSEKKNGTRQVLRVTGASPAGDSLGRPSLVARVGITFARRPERKPVGPEFRESGVAAGPPLSGQIISRSIIPIRTSDLKR